MKSHIQSWIFVISDGNDVFKKRIDEEKWPIFQNTHNRKRLRIGDKIIFYKAGTDGKKFLGSASITNKSNEYNGSFSIVLSNIDIWKKPIKVASVLNNLKFIKNKTLWGCYFQGGVKPLTESDYSTILFKKNRMN